MTTKIKADSQLNMSCTLAQAKAFLNCSLSPAWVKATMILVTLVPMLAPMIMGMAVLTGAPAETSPTMIEVDVEEDWTRTVTRTPIITPTIGFLSSSELVKRAPIFLPPMIRKLSERRNTCGRQKHVLQDLSLSRRGYEVEVSHDFFP